MDAFVDTQQTQSPRMAVVNGWQHPNTVEENRVTHWLESDLETMEQRFRAKLINSIAGFKPALLVGTVDTLGRPNLAVFIERKGSKNMLDEVIDRYAKSDIKIMNLKDYIFQKK